MHTGLWWGYLREEDHLEDPGIDGRNIKMDIQEWDERIWNELIWLKAGAGGGRGSCKCCNELSGSIKCSNFFLTI